MGPFRPQASLIEHVEKTEKTWENMEKNYPRYFSDQYIHGINCHELEFFYNDTRKQVKILRNRPAGHPSTTQLFSTHQMMQKMFINNYN
jgi:hypothetical protein